MDPTALMKLLVQTVHCNPPPPDDSAFYVLLQLTADLNY